MAQEDGTIDIKHNMKISIIPWSLYGVLVIARILVGPLLHGYIHPDELFQSGQEIWYGYPPIIAWEFKPKNALRSVLPPGVMTGIPLQLYGMLSGNTTEFSGQEILLIPRFACAIMSVLTVDWSIWSVVSVAMRQDEKSFPLSLLLLASAWPTMVLLNRPFSNSMETCFVALLVAAILPRKKLIAIRSCVYIGMLCALGLFTRFTFVFFAIPVMLLFLYDLIRTETRLRNATKKIMATAIAFFIGSFVLILADTLFYSSDYFSNQNVTLTSIATFQDLVVTPWNALMYNSKVSNLQEHGLHPRWTHGLVNMFILFGPLTLLGYWKIIVSSTVIWKQQNQQYTNDDSQQQLQQSNRTTKLAGWIIVSGLGFLSLAPHQEPRFLLPLLVPLVLLASNDGESAIWKNNGRLQVLAAIVWIVFNAILFTLFGVLHQSGVVPSLLGLGQVMAHQQPPNAILFYHTYMPPSFLLRQATSGLKIVGDETCVNSAEANAEGYCATTTGTFGTLMDLNGSDWASLEQALDERLDCKEEESNSTDSVVLVMPTMIQEPSGNDNSWSFTPDECILPGGSYDCHLLTSHGNHLSTEDLPPFGGSLTQFCHNMALNVYQISCKHFVNE